MADYFDEKGGSVSWPGIPFMREDRNFLGRVVELGPLLWWGLIAAVILESVAAGGCRRSTPGRSPDGLTPAPPCPKPARAPGLKVTAARLDHDFAHLKAASADATYRGKWLEISGALAHVPTMLATGQWEMLLRTPKGAASLKLSFPSSCLPGQRARINESKAQSRITATCRINNALALVDCSLR